MKSAVTHSRVTAPTRRNRFLKSISELDCERIVLGVLALRADENLAGLGGLIVEPQVQTEPFTASNREVHTIREVKSMKVDRHRVTAVCNVDAIAILELDNRDVLECAPGA